MNRLSLFVLFIACSGSISKAMESDHKAAQDALFQQAQNYLNSRSEELNQYVSRSGNAGVTIPSAKELEWPDRHLVELFANTDPIVMAAQRRLDARLLMKAAESLGSDQ